MTETTQLSQPCIQKIHLLHNGNGMTMFLSELDSSLLDDYLIHKLVELAGGGGQVARLTNEEVCQDMVNNLSYSMHMQDKAKHVGDMVKTNHILCKALSMQAPTKKQRNMAQQAVDILKRAQTVASHKLRKLHAKTESEDEEDEQANA